MRTRKTISSSGRSSCSPHLSMCLLHYMSVLHTDIDRYPLILLNTQQVRNSTSILQTWKLKLTFLTKVTKMWWCQDLNLAFSDSKFCVLSMGQHCIKTCPEKLVARWSHCLGYIIRKYCIYHPPRAYHSPETKKLEEQRCICLKNACMSPYISIHPSIHLSIHPSIFYLF